MRPVRKRYILIDILINDSWGDFYYVFTTIDVCVLHNFATICIFTYIFIESCKCPGDFAKPSKTTRYLSNYEGEIL